MDRATPEQCRPVFERLRAVVRTKPTRTTPPLDATRLSRFFEALRASLTGDVPIGGRPARQSELDVQALTACFERLREPIDLLRKSGGFCNPWEVARLGRDEVRNTAVLSWLLDPHGDHGLGDVLLCALLQRINRAHADIPPQTDGRVFVIPEVCPEDDSSNRVDIEIRCDGGDRPFYLLIEVKIDALEGPEQLMRYGEAARKLAGARPWAMVFLTPYGSHARTAGAHSNRVVRLSWNELARILQRALDGTEPTKHTDQGFSFRLAERYLRHVRTFNGGRKT